MKRIELMFLISQRVPRFAPGLRHRDIDVGAHGTLFHVAVAGAEIAQDRAHLAQELGRFLGRAQVGAADDLHQGDARAVEIDIGVVGMLIVDALARILLEMQALDADLDRVALGMVDDELALADNGLLVLRDLIAGRQIGIEIVLPVEHRRD